MTAYESLMLYALAGQITPHFIDFINKHVSSANWRFAISLLVCAVLSLIFNFQQLASGNVQAYLLDALILWTSAQAAFKYWYDGSEAQAKIRYSTSPLPLAALIPSVATVKSAFPLFTK